VISDKTRDLLSDLWADAVVLAEEQGGMRSEWTSQDKLAYARHWYLAQRKQRFAALAIPIEQMKSARSEAKTDVRPQQTLQLSLLGDEPIVQAGGV
jgi:hypothetical protein